MGADNSVSLMVWRCRYNKAEDSQQLSVRHVGPSLFGVFLLFTV